MDYVVGLGANLGSRRATLEAALALLARVARVERCSALYESESLAPGQPHYLNAAVRVQSGLAPAELLARCLAIEALLGRKRDPALRYAARTVDLDILWAETPLASERLTVPHARLHERWFALAPLLDVAPELAAEYGAALAACGGRRAAYREPLALAPRGQAQSAGGALLLSASAAGAADAVADALAALGRALSPGETCAMSHARVVHAAGTPEGAFAALVRAALSAAVDFAFARAVVTELGPRGSEARLLGRPLPRARSLPGLRAAEMAPKRDTTGIRIELDTAARTSHELLAFSRKIPEP